RRAGPPPGQRPAAAGPAVPAHGGGRRIRLDQCRAGGVVLSGGPRFTVTVADPPPVRGDGGRSTPGWCRRWPIRPRMVQTVADPPPDGADGGRSAPGWCRRWPICRHFVGVSRRYIDQRLATGGDDGR